MSHFVSAINNNTRREGDYITAFASFSNTPAYAKMMENPIERQNFAKMMEGRKEQAIRNGSNSDTVNLFSKLANAAKNYVSNSAGNDYTEKQGFTINA